MVSFFNFFENPDSTENTVIWISIGTIVLLMLVVVALSFNKRKADTRSIAFAGVCVALSFALSFAKIPIGLFGGSITIASMVPIIIYAYVFGPIKGLMVGIVYGLFQFLQEPYIFTPLSFFLDYILPFAGVAIVGLFALIFKRKQKTAVIAGTVCAYIWRFAMHFFSGLLYFEAGWISEGLPSQNAWLYSFVYQCTYIPLDMIIALAILIPLVCTAAFSRITRVMRPTTIEQKETDTPAVE